LTPNKTRRAQCANWLIFFREELFGYTVEELKERRRLKQEKEEQERLQKVKESGEDKKEWKPPVREVY
jgi:cell shape-determining protein MreC